MRWKNQLIKFSVILVCSVFIFLFSLIVSTQFKSFFLNDTFAEETKIATLSIEDLTGKQALDLLEREITEWKKKTKVIVEMDRQIVLDNMYYQFQPGETIKQVNDAKTTSVSVSIDEDKLTKMLETEYSINKVQALNFQKLVNDLQEVAKNLVKGTYIFDLNEYIQIDLLEDSILSEASINVDNIVSLIGKEPIVATIIPNSQFSLQNVLESEKLIDLDDQTVSILATVLYSAIISSPFNIIERHISRELPHYTKLGFEAVYKKDKWDLKFFNPTNQSYELLIDADNNQLIAQIRGAQIESYQIVLNDEKTYPTRTIMQYNSSLSQNEESVKKEGKEGQSVTVYRQVFVDGELQNETKIADDYYPPIYKIVHQGLPLNLIHSPIIEENEEVEENMDLQDDSSTNINEIDEVAEKEDSKKNVENNHESIQDTDENRDDDGLWEKPKIEK